MGNIDVVGSGANVLILAVSKDINADDVRLSVAVLAGLGGTDISNLARTTVDDDVATFTNETRLHGKRGGCPGIGGVDGKVLLLIRHCAKAATETLALVLADRILESTMNGCEQSWTSRHTYSVPLSQVCNEHHETAAAVGSLLT